MSSSNHRRPVNEAHADVIGSAMDDDVMDTSENDTRQAASAAASTNVDGEEDEVVCEIPVFLSPALSRNLQLIQYPLQQHQRDNEVPNKPSAVRIKQRHCMMEVDYPTPEHIQVQGTYHMAERTFSSHTVPISTHMAMGKLLTLDQSQVTSSSNNSQPGVGLYLVPLSRITQLRPNFAHIDEETPGTAGFDEERMRQEQQQEQDNQAASSRRPVSFQKKESERAALARKSSYAFKKASEDAEQWHHLEIHDATSATATELMKKVRCSNPQHQLLDPAALIQETAKHTSARSLNERYVNSMNYLPSTEQHHENGSLVISDTSDEDESKITNIVSKLVKIMHLGFPIPFSLLRQQFVDTISDETLFVALGSCAVLVRGNFCLASRLTGMPPAMAQARTFLLFLFQSMQVVHRQRLEHVFATPQMNGSSNNVHLNDPNSQSVTPAMIGMLLDQVGKKTADGWVLKVDDDPSFAEQYPETLLAHAHYWTKVMELFKPMLQRYREPIRAND
jgi:DNA-directed RNA polymerase-3 subunit RPC5